MSYIAFARKWRPQTFDDIIGQEYVVTTLKNSINSNRLHHAFIFAGPRGVGKTSTARILAKSLNCQNGTSVTPCNVCSTCVEITESRSLDCIEIDGASNRGIEEIRTLRENVKFAPTRGLYKIYIIDEVHMLTSEAFNALLKTLEEPPAHVKFIFATTQPQKIISTIISRCQFLPFQRVLNVEIIKKLKEIAVSEKLKVEDDVFLAVARASDGSLRDAESMLDELVSFTNADIHTKDINSILGVVEQDILFEITNKVIKKDTAGALNLLDSLIDQGKDSSQLLLSLIEHFRNLMIVKVASQNHEKLLDLPIEVCQSISKQAQQLALNDIFFAFNALLEAQEMAKRIDSLRIPLEIVLVKLSSQGKSLGQGPAPEAGLKKKDIEAKLEPVEENNKQPAIAIGFNKVKEQWPLFMDELRRVKVSAAHYMEEGRPVDVLDGVLVVGFPKSFSFHKEALESKENRLVLETICRDVFKTDIRVNFSLVQRDDQPQEPFGDEVDPVIQAAINTFNGRVVRKD